MRPFSAPICLLVSACLLLPSPSAAELSDAVSEDDRAATFLDDITVTATRGAREVDEVAGTVSVLSTEEIEERLVGDTRDLVRYEPGVYVDSSSERLGLGGFNIRGIGGNRVLTRIDGIPAAEGFEFGHFTVPPFTLDVASVQKVEILRGAASSLYGSDALGGVVSFETKDPVDYLGAERWALSVASRWDGRYDQLATSLTAALQGDRWQSSLSAIGRAGHERDNQGEVATADSSRTAPNPQDHESLGWLAKVSLDASDRSVFELALERFDHRGETEVLSSQGTLDLGRILGFPPFMTYLVDKASVLADDTQERSRLSVEQGLTGAGLDHLLWRAYLQRSETRQETDEIRITTLGGGPFGPLSSVDVLRQGLMTFEEEKAGGELRGHEALGGALDGLLTFGASLSVDRFDQLRDRPEYDLRTGERLAASDGLTYPTKYFPESRVTEAGLYAQVELSMLGGRLLLVPGVRYDLFDLAIDENDEIFLAGNVGTEPPVEIEDESLSPKLGAIANLGRGWSLHAQYARGFRAPPYSAVNSGFTHLAGGLTRLPNPELRPETSDGFELGVRGSFDRGSLSLTFFDNRYDDFIELVTLGLNPATGLIEFQQRNLRDARIHGFEAAADLNVRDRWYLRGALSSSSGEDRSLSQPLNSIQPPHLALGIRRSLAADRGSLELAARLVDEKKPTDLNHSETEQFATPAYEVLDLFGGWRLSSTLDLRAGIYNLTDETYWEWADALGLSSSTRALDRYTGPGRNVAVAISYRRQ